MFIIRLLKRQGYSLLLFVQDIEECEGVYVDLKQSKLLILHAKFKSLLTFCIVIDQNFEYVQKLIPDLAFDQNNAFQPV